MAIDASILAAARSGNREALTRILAMHYPQVWRMAVNLTGRQALGDRVARDIMSQSLEVADAWEHEEAPTRWFRHHTVLAAREAAPQEPARDDVLLAHGPRDARYAAFVRALRSLPHQQREAFLLNHGEGFDLRQLGIAMDCSVEAAGTHLRQATTALEALAGPDWRRLLQELKGAYAASQPESRLALPYARRVVRRGFWSTLAGIVAWLLLLGLIAALAYGAWWLWPRVVW